MLISSHGLSRKSKNDGIEFFFGLIDRALCNAFIALNKITKAKMKSLDFQRRVAQFLITRGRPPKVRRPLSYAPPAATKKRKSLTYSFPQSVRRQNLGLHWPNYDKKRCFVRHVQRTSMRLAPHIKCSACDVFLSLNEKKNCFAKIHDL